MRPSLSAVRPHRHARRPQGRHRIALRHVHGQRQCSLQLLPTRPLNALAYAQGSDIHVAPGQEQHLPHEAWHIVQQAQGRVKPTMQMKHGVPGNDDAGLEHQADVMGAKALAPPGRQPADGSRRLTAAGRVPAARVPATTGGNIQLKKKSLRARIEEKKAKNRDEFDARDRRFLAREAARDRARNLPRPDASALQAEISRRNIRRQQQGAAVAKTIREGKRPDPPEPLAAKGQVPGIAKPQDLTAHHLVPYNFIRNFVYVCRREAGSDGDAEPAGVLGQGSTNSSEAFRALAYQAEHKPKPKPKAKLTAEQGLARQAAAKEEKRLGIAPFHRQEPPNQANRDFSNCSSRRPGPVTTCSWAPRRNIAPTIPKRAWMLSTSEAAPKRNRAQWQRRFTRRVSAASTRSISPRASTRPRAGPSPSARPATPATTVMRLSRGREQAARACLGAPSAWEQDVAKGKLSGKLGPHPQNNGTSSDRR